MFRFNQEGAERKTDKTIPLLSLLALFCGIAFLFLAFLGWNNDLLDQHGFRQTQTALTAYYLQRGGPFFEYETPLLGMPWSIPFEFPLYQGIVAVAANVLGTPLDQTGRAISLLFWVGCLAIVWLLLGELQIRPAHRLVFLSLLGVSPQYAFWSRTFMIESTALFFSLVWLYFLLRYLRQRDRTAVFWGGLAGVVGGLVKITTFLVFVKVGFLAAAIVCYREVKESKSSPRYRSLIPVLITLALFGLSLVPALVWTRYADSVKSRNLLANPHLTATHLSKWNFGTWEQRVQVRTWGVVAKSRMSDAVGSAVIVALAAGAILYGRQFRTAAAICLLGYMLSLLTFTNLYLVHSYYAYANAILLVGFVGFGVLALLERGDSRSRVAALGLLGLTVALSLVRYFAIYEPTLRLPPDPLRAVAAAVAEHSDPNETFAAFGLDWSPQVTYYSGRRSLLFPTWTLRQEEPALSQSVQAALGQLGKEPPRLVALCYGAESDPRIQRLLNAYLPIPPTPVFANDACKVYDRKAMRNADTPPQARP